MMSKTHVTVGIASSLGLALVFPKTPQIILVSIAFGALGGTTPDVDILDDDYKHDALIGQVIPVGLCGLLLGLDWLLQYEILSSIINHKILAIIGVIGYLILYLIGFGSDHREFTHSFLSLLLFSIAVAFIHLPAVPFYAIGYFSHLAIDLLNKKGIQLFFPLEPRPCLKLCYANEAGNKILMYLGLGASIILLIMKLARS